MGSLTSGFWHLEACPYLVNWDEPLSQIAQTTWAEKESQLRKQIVWVLLLRVCFCPHRAVFVTGVLREKTHHL